MLEEYFNNLLKNNQEFISKTRYYEILKFITGLKDFKIIKE